MRTEDVPVVVGVGQVATGAVYDAGSGPAWTDFYAEVGADQPGTLTIWESTDSVSWSPVVAKAIPASYEPIGVSAVPTDRFVRASWQNGGSRPTTALEMRTVSTQNEPAETDEASTEAVAAAVAAPFTLTGTSDAVQLHVKGNATQTSNLAEFLDHAGTHGFTVGATGECTVSPSGSDGLLMSNTGIVLVADGDDPQDAVNRRQLDAAGWQGAYSGATTYAKDALVTGSDGHVYVSKAPANVGNDPTTDAGAHWQALAA